MLKYFTLNNFNRFAVVFIWNFHSESLVGKGILSQHFQKYSFRTQGISVKP